MKQQLKQRLKEFRAEFESGQKSLANIEIKTGEPEEHPASHQRSDSGAGGGVSEGKPARVE